MRTLLGVGPHHDQIRPTALNVIPGCRRPRLVAWPKGNVLPISRLGFICRHDQSDWFSCSFQPSVWGDGAGAGAGAGAEAAVADSAVSGPAGDAMAMLRSACSTRMAS